ncbi:hypothetical protein FW774_09410 [Pedobacter sp. BS3]|uniref:hypothetical protein n=1 Tax=Pedobacter sp. BS3 TaxID=2567937 RepID=UPI0011EFAD0B|nr:hypothetical protein [Pedobacter sp. BS3]TZF83682.1 hypothetical protein FW774_09410 [Pedobacter sp. BS3]
MKHSVFIIISLLSGLTLFSACTDNQPEKSSKPVVRTVLPRPFTYHKVVEVKPGLIFDVLAWGRGKDGEGAYVILRSDSTHNRFQSLSGAMGGKIVDVWNTDLDNDGNPEIFIQAVISGERNYLDMYVYEFDNNGNGREISFPKLTAKTQESYRGRDSVYMKEGKLIREFPLYQDADADNKPTGGKKIVQYDIRNNSFDLHELKPEDLEKK